MAEAQRQDTCVCIECGRTYSLAQARCDGANYMDAPYHYDQAEKEYCLACFLGLGPQDIAEIEAEIRREAVERGEEPPCFPPASEG